MWLATGRLICIVCRLCWPGNFLPQQHYLLDTTSQVAIKLAKIIYWNWSRNTMKRPDFELYSLPQRELNDELTPPPLPPNTSLPHGCMCMCNFAGVKRKKVGVRVRKLQTNEWTPSSNSTAGCRRWAPGLPWCVSFVMYIKFTKGLFIWRAIVKGG